MASQITSLTIVYSTVYSGENQRKHQSSASLAFVWGIHRWPMNSPHKGPVTRKMFPFDDVIIDQICSTIMVNSNLARHSGNKQQNNTFVRVVRSCSLHVVFYVIKSLWAHVISRMFQQRTGKVYFRLVVSISLSPIYQSLASTCCQWSSRVHALALSRTYH